MEEKETNYTHTMVDEIQESLDWLDEETNMEEMYKTIVTFHLTDGNYITMNSTNGRRRCEGDYGEILGDVICLEVESYGTLRMYRLPISSVLWIEQYRTVIEQ